MSVELNVASLAGGGLVERIHEEIAKTVANCLDPNTVAKKARKVQMVMTIKPNEPRTTAEVSVTVSSTLCPASPIETSLMLGIDPVTKEVGASEVLSGENPGQAVLPEPAIEQHMSGKGKIVALAKGVQ